MDLKKILATALVSVTAVSSVFAFDLGKKNEVIYYKNKKNAVCAKELASYLHRIFGKKYTVKTVGKDLKAPGIYVGVAHSAVKTPAPIEKDYIALYANDKQLFLFGNDNAKLVGSSFAVYDFLDKYCGVRFLWPGELGTVVEKRKPITISPRTETYVPPFDLRMTSSYTYGLNKLTRQGRAELNHWLDAHKVGRSIYSRGSGFQHAFAHLLPKEVYGKDHPEYYSLITPQRWIGGSKPTKPTRKNDPTVAGPWQLCTSNKDVRRIIAEKIAKPKDGYIRSISPNDGFGFCECANCLAQDGENSKLSSNGHLIVTNRMYDFAEDIAKQVYKLNPKAKVGMFAYSFYDGVPDQKINFPPNMYLSYYYMVMYADRDAEKKISDKIVGLAATGAKVIGREYWGTHYTMCYPLSHSRKIDRNVKLLYKNNAAGIYGETGRDFAARATDLYILNKLSWNPMLKREALLKEFCDAAFGKKASPVMYELFEKIEDRVEKMVENKKVTETPVLKHYTNGYAERNRFMSVVFDAEFQKMCAPYIAKARRLADTPERKARVDFFNIGLRHAKITTESLVALRDLAACGVNLPLTQPSANFIPMEKSQLIKVASRAVKAENVRGGFYRTVGNEHAIRGVFTTAMNLRPWQTLAQLARIQLTNGTYNYVVNGAFEYNGFSWEVKNVKGNGKYTYTLQTNCDDPVNVMVTSHAYQGVSLQLDTKAGDEICVKQLRPIVLTVNTVINGALNVRCTGNPLDSVELYFGDKKLNAYWADKDAKSYNDNWKELRIQSETFPAGNYNLRIVVKNNTKGLFCSGKDLSFNFDDIKVTLKELRAVNK
ncbi:MAG: DUF4838 domain-containing protein [Lentisphaeria bacterium]|nr:DUF4838 domain-containing protein [Lentisphaeria bacterium]